jgi:hypothetical protein
MIATKLSREFLEQQLLKLTPKRYNQFVWWRRYEVRQTLSEKSPLHSKIVNGDYEHSDYYYQAQMENYLLEDKIKDIKYFEDQLEHRSLFGARWKRLIDDYEKDEKEIVRKMKKDFKATFGIPGDELELIMEDFDGTTLDLYTHIKELTRERRMKNLQLI